MFEVNWKILGSCEASIFSLSRVARDHVASFSIEHPRGTRTTLSHLTFLPPFFETPAQILMKRWIYLCFYQVHEASENSRPRGIHFAMNYEAPLIFRQTPSTSFSRTRHSSPENHPTFLDAKDTRISLPIS